MRVRHVPPVAAGTVIGALCGVAAGATLLVVGDYRLLFPGQDGYGFTSGDLAKPVLQWLVTLSGYRVGSGVMRGPVALAVMALNGALWGTVVAVAATGLARSARFRWTTAGCAVLALMFTSTLWMRELPLRGEHDPLGSVVLYGNSLGLRLLYEAGLCCQEFGPVTWRPWGSGAGNARIAMSFAVIWAANVITFVTVAYAAGHLWQGITRRLRRALASAAPVAGR